MVANEMDRNDEVDENNKPATSGEDMRKSKKNLTLNDLAKATGVSKSTISRVFNNPEKVKESTRKQIRKAAEKLGYYPNRVASRLSSGQGKAKVIGLIIPDIKNPFFADITRGVEDVALSNRFALILNNSDESMERQRICLETFRMEGVDGIILPPADETDSYVQELLSNGIVVVCVDRKIKNAAVDSILSDNRKGSYTAITHLISLGHRRIAFISGIPRLSTSKERLDGYKDALNEHGIEVDETLILEGDSRQESGELLTRKLLSLPNPPTALLTGNNMITLGSFIACNRLGKKIPDEIALVGYDDAPWSDALNPPLTVIDQSAYEIGRRAAEMLFSRIRNPEGLPVTLTLDPRLIIRASCGANNMNN